MKQDRNNRNEDSTTPLDKNTEKQLQEILNERRNELNDGLLGAYAAGFAKALEEFNVETELEPDVRSLKNTEFIVESHHYYWDGRTKPLEQWLPMQFGVGEFNHVEKELKPIEGIDHTQEEHNSEEKEVTNTPVEELSHSKLKKEHDELLKKLIGNITYNGRVADLHDRKEAIWNELKSRTDEEPPECPDCGNQQWAQEMGNPKRCVGCGKELSMQDMGLIEEIDEYWESMLSGSS